jgi:hypothetical protein
LQWLTSKYIHAQWKNYIESAAANTDANSAMAFFYPALNSWVLSSSKGAAKMASTSADNCQKQLCHVEFPLRFQTEGCSTCFVVKLSRRSAWPYLNRGR